MYRVHGRLASRAFKRGSTRGTTAVLKRINHCLLGRCGANSPLWGCMESLLVSAPVGMRDGGEWGDGKIWLSLASENCCKPTVCTQRLAHLCFLGIERWEQSDPMSVCPQLCLACVFAFICSSLAAPDLTSSPTHCEKQLHGLALRSHVTSPKSGKFLGLLSPLRADLIHPAGASSSFHFFPVPCDCP